jgi:hypothetical protein
MQSEKERKGKEKKKKKEKSISVKLDLTTIHTLPRKEEDFEKHQMMWRKLDFNHRRQLHASASFFYVHKIKNAIMTK